MSNYRRKPQNLLKGYKATHLDFSSESKPIDATKGGKRHSKIKRWADKVLSEKRSVRKYEKDSLIRKEKVREFPQPTFSLK